MIGGNTFIDGSSVSDIYEMDLIGKIPNISDVEPMTFPFVNEETTLREDEVGDYLTVAEVLENTKYQVNDQVKVPKVVE